MSDSGSSIDLRDQKTKHWMAFKHLDLYASKGIKIKVLKSKVIRHAAKKFHS